MSNLERLEEIIRTENCTSYLSLCESPHIEEGRKRMMEVLFIIAREVCMINNKGGNQ